MGLTWQDKSAQEELLAAELAAARALADDNPKVASASLCRQKQRRRQWQVTDVPLPLMSSTARGSRAARVEDLPLTCCDLPFAACLDAFSLRTAEDEEADFGPRLRSMLERRCLDWGDLPRESDNGYIEYKWRLGTEHDSPQRAQRLATQMKFRLGEGGGTAFYLLGVHDSGSAAGLSPDEHAAAVRVLMGAAAITGAVLLLEAMSERRHGDKRCSAWRVQHRDTALRQVADLLHLSLREPWGVQEARMLSEDGGLRGVDTTMTRLVAALCC